MISKSEYDMVQTIISEKYKAKPRYKDFAFTGLMRCGECGSSITAMDKIKRCKNGNEHHYTYYHCTKHKKDIRSACTQKTIRVENLEQEILHIINKITIPHDFREWIVVQLKKDKEVELADRQNILKSLQTDLGLIERKLETILTMRMDQELDVDEYSQKKSEFMKEKHRIEELLNDIHYRFDTWLQKAEATLDFAETAKEKFEKGDIATKREVLIKLGWNLLLTNGKLTISLTKPLLVVESISKELQILHTTLEPMNAISQQEYDRYCGENEVWGGRGDSPYIRCHRGNSFWAGQIHFRSHPVR